MTQGLPGLAFSALVKAAQNTLAHYKAIAPRMHCMTDELNPCDLPDRAGTLQHWGGGDACPLCSARFAVNAAQQA